MSDDGPDVPDDPGHGDVPDDSTYGDVPDDSAYGSFSAVVWALAILAGAAMFAYEFGGVPFEGVPAGAPIEVVHSLRSTLSILSLLGGGGTVVLIAYVVYRYAAPKRSSADVLRPGTGKYAVSMYTLGILFLMLTTMFIGAAALAQTDDATEPTRQVETDRELGMTVVGGQWFWRFEVEGMDHAQGNHVVVPANTVIDFEVKSADVIHSFAVQELGLKKDAVPGQTNHGWFMVEDVDGETTIQAGNRTLDADTYQVNCAELCGKGHSQMVAQVVVVSPQDYETWVEANDGTVPESFHQEEEGGHGEEEGEESGGGH